jgi:Ca2+-binding EF-hand superfamily protein
MQMMALQIQLTLLEELETMSDDEKLETLFQVLDKDQSGSLSAVELADGLCKI